MQLTPRQLLSLWLGLLLAILSGCARPVPESNTLAFELALPNNADVASAEVSVIWLGADRRLDLTPTPDRPTVLRGSMSGPPLRILPLTIRLRTTAGETLVGFHSLEVLTGDDHVLQFALDERQPQLIRRLSSGGLPEEVERREQAWILASLLWGALLLVGTRWMSRYRRRSGVLAPPRSLRWEGLGWLALAVAWTWPAVRAGDAWLVGRNFDAAGTVWTLDALPRMGLALQDGLTRWPDGADYASLDSFTLHPLAWLFQWLGPVRLHGLLQVVGVATSAWATSAFARAVGARAPWTLLAGLGFAFSGIAANVLLEGHVYHLLAPWLPLFGWAWWRAMGPDGRPRHGFAAGACFVLTLLTTGYLGVTASVVAIGFFLAGLAREGSAVWRPAVAALAVVLPVGLAYVWQLADSTGLAENHTTEAALRLGAASVRTLAGPSPEVDRFDHALALGVPGVVLALVLVAPRVLEPSSRWRRLAATGAVSLFIAMGPVLALRANASGLPSPIGWLWSLPGASLLRFPARLSWAWFLCGSVLAAVVATHLAQRRERLARWLLVAALVDAFVVVRLPWRQQTRLATAPSAYQQVDGPLLELLPEGQNPNGELDNWFNATSCLYQTVHQKPISDDCVMVPIEENPRWVRSRWVVANLLSGEVEAVHARMVKEGFRGLVLHPDLLFRGDRTRLEAALSTLDAHPVRSTDGGEHIVIYALGEAPGPAALPDATGTADGLEVELQGMSSPSVGYSIQWSGDGNAPVSEALGPYDSTSGARHNPRPIATVDGVVPTATTSILWRHTLRETLPRTGRLTLLATVDGAVHTAWEGPLQLREGVDRVSFRLTSPTTAEPTLVAPEAFSPPAHETVSPAVLLGWLSIGLAALVGWRRR